MKFLMNSKQRKAAKTLENASKHIYSRRDRAAFEILIEAERFVRCGFRMPDWREFLHMDESNSIFWQE